MPTKRNKPAGRLSRRERLPERQDKLAGRKIGWKKSRREEKLAGRKAGGKKSWLEEKAGWKKNLMEDKLAGRKI
jgi:hypothetical protein